MMNTDNLGFLQQNMWFPPDSQSILAKSDDDMHLLLHDVKTKCEKISHIVAYMLEPIYIRDIKRQQNFGPKFLGMAIDSATMHMTNKAGTYEYMIPFPTIDFTTCTHVLEKLHTSERMNPDTEEQYVWLLKYMLSHVCDWVLYFASAKTTNYADINQANLFDDTNVKINKLKDIFTQVFDMCVTQRVAPGNYFARNFPKTTQNIIDDFCVNSKNNRDAHIDNLIDNMNKDNGIFGNTPQHYLPKDGSYTLIATLWRNKELKYR